MLLIEVVKMGYKKLSLSHLHLMDDVVRNPEETAKNIKYKFCMEVLNHYLNTFCEIDGSMILAEGLLTEEESEHAFPCQES